MAQVWIALAILPLLLANPSTSPLVRFEQSEPHMGTTFRVVLYAADRRAADRGFARAFQRIAGLDASLSDYRDNSELSRITREAVGRPIPVSDDLFNVLNAADGLARQSDGAFDITIGSLSRLWRRARRQLEMPAPGDLDAARAVTGYRLVTLDAAHRTVQFARAGIRLDAGGIAKGYAADRALAEIAALGMPQALVAAGGDLAIGEAPPDRAGWEVTLAGLDADRPAPPSPVTVSRCGISTSGDAEQWVEIGGVRYSHIIDPRTGTALKGHRSVSVIARDATSSDMLATALSVLEPGEGKRVIAHYRGAAALVGIRTTNGDRWTQTRLWRRGSSPADRRSK